MRDVRNEWVDVKFPNLNYIKYNHTRWIWLVSLACCTFFAIICFMTLPTDFYQWGLVGFHANYIYGGEEELSYWRQCGALWPRVPTLYDVTSTLSLTCRLYDEAHWLKHLALFVLEVETLYTRTKVQLILIDLRDVWVKCVHKFKGVLYVSSA